MAKAARLSGDQRRELAAALLFLPLVWIAIRVLGFNRLHQWILRTPANNARALTFEDARAMGALVNVATATVLGRGNCLTRSMYLLLRLRRLGAPGELKIGMRLIDDRLEGHAWVVIEGEPVNDAKNIAEQYVAFADPIGSGARFR
jgi:hypothetical protein